MATPLFTFSVHDLDAAGKALEFSLGIEWMKAVFEDAEATVTAPGKAVLRASKTGEQILVLGDVSADLTVPCARCLEPAAITIREKCVAMFVPPAKAAHSGGKGEDDEYEFSADEADMVPFDGEEIVLDDVLRDTLLLEIPMTPLCSADCPGMSHPSKDFEEPTGDVDPRLAPLLKFRKQIKEQ